MVKEPPVDPARMVRYGPKLVHDKLLKNKLVE